MIDIHTHCRDGNQAHKETIKHVFEIAKNQGIEKIFDMPNTDPPITTRQDIEKRLKLVPKDRKNDYFIYIGATKDEKQLEEAVHCYHKYKEIIGIKLFAGKSVGNLAVIELESQKKVYETLSKLKYTGVLAIHCEKESLLKPELWDPTRPITHSYARPKEAEIESIKDQIKLARQTNFKGALHICHVSCPESVEIINQAKNKIKITCEVTPHHILWTNKKLERPDGLLYKTNPPLRKEEDVNKLRQYLKEGKIDCIGTDHAPHTIGEKLFAPHLSGFPSLYLYKHFIKEYLPRLGLSQTAIEKLTHKNIIKIFNEKILL